MMNPDDIYRNQPLAQGFPGIEQRYVTTKQRNLEAAGLALYPNRGGLRDILTCFERIAGSDRQLRTVAVDGCGTRPQALLQLLEGGFDAIGVEPGQDSLLAAQEYIKDLSRVKLGTAEAMPFPATPRNSY